MKKLFKSPIAPACAILVAALFATTSANASERARMHAACVQEGAKKIIVEASKDPSMASLIQLDRVGDEYVVSPMKTVGLKDTSYSVRDVGGKLVVKADLSRGASAYIKQAVAACPI